MQFFSNLAKSPVETLDTWQKTRYPWAIMAATMAGLVLVAHFVFQEWLYMGALRTVRLHPLWQPCDGLRRLDRTYQSTDPRTKTCCLCS